MLRTKVAYKLAKAANNVPSPTANMLPAGACAASPLLVVGAAEPVLVVKLDMVVRVPDTPVAFAQLDLETELLVPVTNLTAEH